MTLCRKTDKVRCRTLMFIRLEEGEEIQKRTSSLNSYENPIRKADSLAHKSYKPNPYSKHGHHMVNALEDEKEEDEFPMITEYCFTMDVSGLIIAMQDLVKKARWPRKEEKSSGWKDKSKWCAYHEYFSHITEDCIALRKEISYLISKEHLKEILGR